ncbi:MAG TPA: ACT domain-containing protein [Thermodesulfovibrionales bacterium]|nr:ACT domain-containing protein [Thermodesulfovibrionales bacterium]
MVKARKARQLSFSMQDRAGALSEITTLIAGAKVNITSICAYTIDETAYFMLIADSNAKAKKALTKLRVKIEEDDVVELEMPDKSGELQKISKKVADAGIDIGYMYGTAGSGRSSTCVFKTSDDKKLIKVVNK